MLFDLRGRGRRRVVKTVYVTLALLLGGGLVLFGIGGEVSGGLVDAITGSSGGGGDGTDRQREREEQAAARTRTSPQDPAAWAELARARFSLANVGDTFDPETGAFTEEGNAALRSAVQAWERHLELVEDGDGAPDPNVASLMVQAYGALGDATAATAAQEIIAADRESAGAYAQLALLAYQANQLRKGDLARDRAVELTDPDMREALRGQLQDARDQATAASTTAEPTPTPSP